MATAWSEQSRESDALILNFEELWRRLNDRDESAQIEAKVGQQIGPAVLETVSAFSNEPGRGGGYLLLGVQLAPDSLFPTYEIVGLQDVQKVQSDLATQCRQAFNHPVRPQISVENIDGKRVIVAFVPEAQEGEKPIYIESRGLPKGAYRRIGSTDQKCTDDDIALFYQTRSHRTFDETIVDDADLNDFDSAAIQEYRRARKETNPNAPELSYSDEDLLYALACLTRTVGNVRPTIAGLLLFGKAASIRRFFPMIRVDYIRVPGREWVKSPDERFESIELLGPLMQTIPRAINAVLDDIPKAFRLPPNSNQRTDVPLIPRTAIREAIVNAVMHRSYRHRQPVQIIRYSNRLEIRNPGHSLVPDDRLGEPGSFTRNEKIAAVLHETRFAETKGSGVRAMRESLAQAGLSPPTFESDRDRDSFVVTFLFHHFLNEDDVAWLGYFSDLQLSEDEARALVFAREVGAINNAAYRDLNRVDTLVASGHLRRLRDAGLLEQQGKSVGTYYIPTGRMLNPAALSGTPGTRLPQGPTPAIRPLSQGSEALSQGFSGLPAELTAAVAELGKRATPADVRPVIRELCAWRPLKAEELARILGRDQLYLTRTYLGPMVRDGELRYTIPDNPAHPQQAYRATPPVAPEGLT
ncbi:MAG: putative DNA binding domain-containing protein [Planctomycetes bacterium]|nr:putative DNA binding domain-containing protein [Planctomycetota bacterium]MBI3833151.1 putative DNA binding domain-containing protein [Planctomycetota bacterium]